jgi:hypothetical protein
MERWEEWHWGLKEWTGEGYGDGKGEALGHTGTTLRDTRPSPGAMGYGELACSIRDGSQRNGCGKETERPDLCMRNPRWGGDRCMMERREERHGGLKERTEEG